LAFKRIGAALVVDVVDVVLDVVLVLVDDGVGEEGEKASTSAPGGGDRKMARLLVRRRPRWRNNGIIIERNEMK
jgi:hypothetical protein